MSLVERKRTDCSALPKGWQREEQTRKAGLSSGKVDVFYYRYIPRDLHGICIFKILLLYINKFYC